MGGETLRLIDVDASILAEEISFGQQKPILSDAGSLPEMLIISFASQILH